MQCMTSHSVRTGVYPAFQARVVPLLYTISVVNFSARRIEAALSAFACSIPRKPQHSSACGHLLVSLTWQQPPFLAAKQPSLAGQTDVTAAGELSTVPSG